MGVVGGLARGGVRGAARFPRSTGARAAGSLAHAIAVEEVARVCASSSLFTFISKLGLTALLDHGSDELKQKYLPACGVGRGARRATASRRPARAATLPGMTTRAVRDGDHYVLNGRKMWITNAGVSDFYTVFAKTQPDAGHRGISAFVVERGFAGLLHRQARAQARCARLTDR